MRCGWEVIEWGWEVGWWWVGVIRACVCVYIHAGRLCSDVVDNGIVNSRNLTIGSLLFELKFNLHYTYFSWPLNRQVRTMNLTGPNEESVQNV